MSRVLLLMAAAAGLVACGAPEARPHEAPAPVVSLRIEERARAEPPPLTVAAAPVTVRVLVGGELPRAGLSSGSLALLTPLLGEADASLAMVGHAIADGPLAEASRARLSGVLVGTPRACGRAERHGALADARSERPELAERVRAAGLAALGAAGGRSVGSSDEPADPWRPQVVAEREGRRACAVGWSVVPTPPKGCAPLASLAAADESRRAKERIETALAGARAAGCDALVAMIYAEGTKAQPRARAQALVAAEAGADAVVVHASSVPAPVEIVLTHDARRVPVFVSVGALVQGAERGRHPHARPAWDRVGMVADLRWVWSSADRGKQALALFDWGYHLVVSEGPASPPRGAKGKSVPGSPSARVLEPRADAAWLDRLGAVPRGPADLLGDRCWFEGARARCH